MAGITARARQHKIDRLIERDGLLCHWCREPFGFDHPVTLDHVIPRFYGGTNNDENLVLACGPCNVRRSHYARCAGCDQRVRHNGIVRDRSLWHPLCVPVMEAVA